MNYYQLNPQVYFPNSSIYTNYAFPSQPLDPPTGPVGAGIGHVGGGHVGGGHVSAGGLPSGGWSPGGGWLPSSSWQQGYPWYPWYPIWRYPIVGW
ncbi:hypothetical protein [Bacillus massiliigorillae]|uniref:hypothetical protein n=1 Tax=Bacillus massiliigorillae TaxID=1243664 RepID=UPI0005A8B9B4|nr:hypothetical protein [Bacillus massiliigorillae]